MKNKFIWLVAALLVILLFYKIASFTFSTKKEKENPSSELSENAPSEERPEAAKVQVIPSKIPNVSTMQSSLNPFDDADIAILAADPELKEVVLNHPFPSQSNKQPKIEAAPTAPAPISKVAAPPSSSSLYYVVAGSFSSLENAQKVVSKNLAAGLSNSKVISVKGNTLQVATINSFDNRASAEAYAKAVKEKYHIDCLVRQY